MTTVENSLGQEPESTISGWTLDLLCCEYLATGGKIFIDSNLQTRSATACYMTGVVASDVQIFSGRSSTWAVNPTAGNWANQAQVQSHP